MKKFEVWSQGFLCTGMEGIPSTAQFHGIYEAENFIEACRKFSENTNEPNYFHVENGKPYYYVQLFDNEIDARKAFG